MSHAATLVSAVLLWLLGANAALAENCTPPDFDKAHFPEILPQFQEPFCVTSKNLSLRGTKIHQNFQIYPSNIRAFQERYLELLVEQGWKITDQFSRQHSQDIAYTIVEAKHESGYRMQLTFNEIVRHSRYVPKEIAGAPPTSFMTKILLKGP